MHTDERGETGKLDRRGVLGLSAGAALLGGGCASATAASEDGMDTKRGDGTEGDELDELFRDLTDRSGDFRPITAAERAPRRERLAAELAARGVDALLVEPGATLDWVSGVSWNLSERLFALVAFADGSHLWVAPAFEVPRAKRRLEQAGFPESPVLGWDEHEYAFAPLAAALRERGVERIAVEPRVRFFVAERLGEAFGRERVVSGLGLVRTLRGVKDAREVELLRGANVLTQEAIAVVSERLRPGLTDHDLGAWIRRAQERLGLRGVWVLPLIGTTAADPHGSPEGRVLERGDVVLVDTGGSLHGYQSDNTRTWVFEGAPTEEVARAWHCVRDAQRAAFEALRAGRPCRRVDEAARAVIAAGGYGAGYESFAHRLGHGIGLEGHEEPYLDGGNDLPLRPGMTFSDEPGIYLGGRFGIRLEDIVLVTEDGADHFGGWQRAPERPHA